MGVSETARVLVVDDEPEIRQLLIDALSGAGLEVQVAASGSQAMGLARKGAPDILVADYRLGDCTGLDVIDRLRDLAGDIPAIVITGYGDAAVLAEASHRRPVALMTKPLNVDRLRAAIRRELQRQAALKRSRGRTRQLRLLARRVNQERKSIHRQLQTTCADLATAYRALNGQMALQQVVMQYQRDLLGVSTDDDAFRALFRIFVRGSGPVFGVAMVCDAEARLRIVGRFGVPAPDSQEFCERLSSPMVDLALVEPRCAVIDAGDRADRFDQSIRRYLVGVSVLVVPLIPVQGELIGLVVLYRKGEQPFTDEDLALAEMVAPATAVAVRRND